MEGFIGKESCWFKQVECSREGVEKAQTGPRLRCAALLDLRSFRGNGGWCRRALMVEAD